MTDLVSKRQDEFLITFHEILKKKTDSDQKEIKYNFPWALILLKFITNQQKLRNMALFPWFLNSRIFWSSLVLKYLYSV